MKIIGERKDREGTTPIFDTDVMTELEKYKLTEEYFQEMVMKSHRGDFDRSFYAFLRD